MATLPRVAVIGTGGTISGIGRDRLDLYEYGTSGRFMHVPGNLATVPEIAQWAEAITDRYRNVWAGSIRSSNWLDLVRSITNAPT